MGATADDPTTELVDVCRPPAAPEAATDDARRANEVVARLRRKLRRGTRMLKESAESLAAERAGRVAAEQANAAKDQVLAVVCHELRTPLNALVGWAHLLQAGLQGGWDGAEAVAGVKQNAQAQARLIEDILDWSRSANGKLRLDWQPVVLCEVVGAATKAVEPAARARSVRIEPPVESGIRVKGDPKRLQQVVWNLLSNAIKFTPTGGRVALRVESADGSAQLRVSDDGIGIASDFLPHVFDRFAQVEAGQHGGLGLGLPLVRRLVELHGGIVTVQSAGRGLGSTFTVSLPSLDAPTPSAQGSRPGASADAAWMH
jgi:signal transduction histidine kinase